MFFYKIYATIAKVFNKSFPDPRWLINIVIEDEITLGQLVDITGMCMMKWISDNSFVCAYTSKEEEAFERYYASSASVVGSNGSVIIETKR